MYRQTVRIAGPFLILSQGRGSGVLHLALILLPSAAILFMILTTFYGPVKAYAAISWVLLAMYLAVRLFMSLDYAPNAQLNFTLLLSAIVWTSLVQGILGAVLIGEAILNKRNWGIVLMAALITLVPFVLFR